MNWLLGRIEDLTDEQYGAVYAMLSDSRRAHIDRIKDKTAKKSSLMATWLLHRLLEPWNLTGNAVMLAENGKPYLQDSPLFISISHSYAVVTCAVSTQPVGIDVEKIRSVDKKLMEYVCTTTERDYVLEDGADTSARFFEVWTAKEALYKKDGRCADLRAIDTMGIAKQTFVIDGYYITIL